MRSNAKYTRNVDNDDDGYDDVVAGTGTRHEHI